MALKPFLTISAVATLKNAARQVNAANCISAAIDITRMKAEVSISFNHPQFALRLRRAQWNDSTTPQFPLVDSPNRWVAALTSVAPDPSPEHANPSKDERAATVAITLVFPRCP